MNAVVYGDRLQRVLPRLPKDLSFVTSRAVGTPEDWLPGLRANVVDGAVAALFQGTADFPVISGLKPRAADRLPRGDSNYLVTLTFHVERS